VEECTETESPAAIMSGSEKIEVSDITPSDADDIESEGERQQRRKRKTARRQGALGQWDIICEEFLEEDINSRLQSTAKVEGGSAKWSGATRKPPIGFSKKGMRHKLYRRPFRESVCESERESERERKSESERERERESEREEREREREKERERERKREKERKKEREREREVAANASCTAELRVTEDRQGKWTLERKRTVHAEHATNNKRVTIKYNTLQVPTHGQVLSGFGETYGDIYISLILVSTMFLSLLVVEACYAQTRKNSELKGEKKSETKAWKRHSDAKFNRVEAEKELRRRQRDSQLGLSKTSAVTDSDRFFTLTEIMQCPHTSSRDLAKSVLVKKVRESLGERTSVVKSATTTFSHCTMLFSFATSAPCRLDPKPGARPPCNRRSFISECFPLAACFKRRRYIARCWEQTVLLALVLFLLLLSNAGAQQSGCSAAQGTYESAISTMVCASLLSSPPTCEVVFSSLSRSTGLSSFLITVEIANSDFSSEGEYISAVILGNQTLGRDYLKFDGADNQCTNMSKILDMAAVPVDTVSSAGELIVRIEASLGVNANECDGSYLYASVKLTRCTGRILT
jgi:hypothetical protein